MTWHRPLRTWNRWNRQDKMTSAVMPATAQGNGVIRQFKRGFSAAGWTLLALFVVVIAALGIYVHTGGGHLTPVLSGSMRPGIHEGDVAVTRQVSVTSLKVGDIVVFTPPNSKEARVHRIYSLQKLPGGKIAVVTKGDFNKSTDPWGKILMQGKTYKVAFVIPKVGWLAGSNGLRWLIVGFVFIGAAIIARWTWKYVRS